MLENKDDKLILGLPKGSLEAATTDLFAKAGYKIEINSRSLYPTINDDEIECMLLRAQEMAMFVEEGMLDCGLTGFDWIQETGAHVVEVCELVYGKVGRNPLRWVLAVPENSDIKCAADLEGKRIATEAVGMTKRYLEANNVKNVRAAKRAIKKAFQNQIDKKGLSIVEVLSTCPTNWGMSPTDALKFVDEKMIPFYPLGVYVDRNAMGGDGNDE